MTTRAEHVKQLMEMVSYRSLEIPSTWTCDTKPDCKMACGMQGFPENRARKALILTHDCGTELALHWLIENADSPDIDAPLPESPILGTRSSGELFHIVELTFTHKSQVMA